MTFAEVIGFLASCALWFMVGRDHARLERMREQLDELRKRLEQR